MTDNGKFSEGKANQILYRGTRDNWNLGRWRMGVGEGGVGYRTPARQWCNFFTYMLVLNITQQAVPFYCYVSSIQDGQATI